ncbi:hypothetical protein N5D77_18150 [Comamonas thiooxydans]|uniref:Uncharacterized protein n=1 Tax=Comamonas thiooxydans TaxID=363952 RepID=A0AA42Q478_9BURK|nr:hypothetical protein [Comamonas thiooxydans]MDH1335849.1 hypothetical protein [Comamonas thiooxydans]MDH1743611.1 hypothetical protein [Comamonas thiooxydans]MDH1788496.1 hypothetical protein [Comamonas thiooxydans]
MAITAINVFIEVDGKQHIAPIRADAADLFMGMLGAFQKDEKHRATLIPLHDDVSEHLIATRRALLKRIEAQREPPPWPRADPKALAAFDPATKVCSHNCGQSKNDPRSENECKFLCDLCWRVAKEQRNGK